MPLEQRPLRDWENPRLLHRNRLEPRATLIPFADIESARTGDRGASPYVRLLNGDWCFFYGGSPRQAPPAFADPAFDDRAWDTVRVPGVWQLQGYGRPQYTNSEYPFPRDPPWVPDDNPVGLYRRTFEVPDAWRDRQVLLEFGGVTSAFYVWVNGRPAGFSKGSHMPAEFNITAFVRPGANLLAVQVFHWSDASYLEDQDMWRLNGIFRDVTLTAVPAVQLRDLRVRTPFDAGYADARLQVAARLHNHGGAPAAGFRLALSLQDPAGNVVLECREPEPPALAAGTDRT